MPLLKVLSKMELEGINLDVQMLQSYSKELSDEISSIEKQVYKLSGEVFNISSPKVREIFDKMQIVEKVKRLNLDNIPLQKKL